MRPALVLASFLFAIGAFDAALFVQSHQQQRSWPEQMAPALIAIAGLGLTDLCLATEARYTRNPAISDPIAPFMDHPGALEHFPTGSFWAWPGTEQTGSKP